MSLKPVYDFAGLAECWSDSLSKSGSSPPCGRQLGHRTTAGGRSATCLFTDIVPIRDTLLRFRGCPIKRAGLNPPVMVQPPTDFVSRAEPRRRQCFHTEKAFP